MGRLTIRYMPILLGLKTSLMILEILGLGSKHPTELVVPPLDEVTKSGHFQMEHRLEGTLAPPE